jgi:hypothetical protein
MRSVRARAVSRIIAEDTVPYRCFVPTLWKMTVCEPATRRTHATEKTPVDGISPELKAFLGSEENTCTLNLALHQCTILDRTIPAHTQRSDQ